MVYFASAPGTDDWRDFVEVIAPAAEPVEPDARSYLVTPIPRPENSFFPVGVG